MEKSEDTINYFSLLKKQLEDAEKSRSSTSKKDSLASL